MSMADSFSVRKMELQQNAVPQILELLTKARQEGKQKRTELVVRGWGTSFLERAASSFPFRKT